MPFNWVCHMSKHISVIVVVFVAIVAVCLTRTRHENDDKVTDTDEPPEYVCVTAHDKVIYLPAGSVEVLLAAVKSVEADSTYLRGTTLDGICGHWHVAVYS